MISNPMRALIGLIFVAAFNVSTAHANPDGAPWGAADPNAAMNCASCHYDQEPVLNSAAITLAGISDQYTPGSVYIIAISFSRMDTGPSGLLVTATGGELYAGGGFLVANGNEIRSIRQKKAEGETKWHMRWQAPDVSEDKVTFYIAVNESNDDQSPFGDVIHFKAVTIPSE